MANYIDRFHAFSNLSRSEFEKEVNTKAKKDEISTMVGDVFVQIKESNWNHNPLELLKLKANAERLGRRIRGGKSFESNSDARILYKQIQEIVSIGSNLLAKLLKDNPMNAVQWLSQFDNLDSFKNCFSTYEQRAAVFTILDSLNTEYIAASAIKKRIELWIRQCQKIPSDKDIKNILSELDEIDVNNMVYTRDFNELLKFNGFKPHIKNIDFAKLGIFKEYWGIVEGSHHFKTVKFKDIVFENCKLSWVHFKGADFKECFFKDCNLSFSVWERARLNKVTFENCLLSRGLFNRSEIKASSFIYCDLSHNNFNNSKLNHVVLVGCNLYGTSFLDAKVEESLIKEDLGLENCLMYGNEKGFNLVQAPTISEPRIAITWNVQTPGPTGKKVETALIKAMGLPMKFNYNPDEIHAGYLLSEIRIIFSKVDIEAKDFISIPYSLIQIAKNNSKDYPITHKILQMAKKITDNVECVVLPGGEHIEEYFYNMKSSDIGEDHRRSILEFGLIYYAREKGLPVMGICRGCQMIGVYYGIPIIDVPSQMGTIKSYTSVEESKTGSQGIIRSIMGRETKGFSYHYQALDLEALEKNKRLEKVYESQGVPKAMEGIEGAPLLAFQFHPEIKSDPTALSEHVADLLLLSSSNLKIFQEFTKSGKTVLEKKALLESLKKKDGKSEESSPST